MDITIYPRKLSGQLKVIPSKSQAHRMLICAAFADNTTTLICPDTNKDIEATAACLRAIGAMIARTTDGYVVDPITKIPASAVLPCSESGSTLRFMLPIAGALGIDAVFQLEGRLPERPLSPLWEEMERMGCNLTRPDRTSIRCSGKLRPGSYCIDGSVSSQFITGLLFAMALMDGDSQLSITGKIESKPYIRMTQRALEVFGVDTQEYCVSGQRPFRTPGTLQVEGDWSNGAFWLAANALGNAIDIWGLDPASGQGDRAVADLVNTTPFPSEIDAADIPDLVPILSVVAAAANGACFHNIARLRLKESDRVATVEAMLRALGAGTESTQNTMHIYPAAFNSCTIDSAGDHRIAMSAAIAATVANGPVTILGAQCVEKSYPSFWDEYKALGGSYEQYIR